MRLEDALVGAYRKLPPRSEVRVYWEDQLRPLLRYKILCGDVRITGGGFDEPASHSKQGLDNGREVALLDALKGLWQLRSNDPFGHMLLVRSVGTHCGDDRCALDGSHWHRQSWMDLKGHTREALELREESAMAYMFAYCV